MLAELGWWGLRHRPGSTPLQARARLLYEGGPELWREFQAELRENHLGAPAPGTDRPTVREHFEAAYERALEEASVPGDG